MSYHRVNGLSIPKSEYAWTIRKSASSYFNHGTDIVQLSTRGKQAIESIFSHESHHFLLHCGSPYGQFLDELALLKRILVRRYLEISDTRIFPAYDFARAFLSERYNPTGSVGDRRAITYLPCIHSRLD
jgi:hypothetical protein